MWDSTGNFYLLYNERFFKFMDLEEIWLWDEKYLQQIILKEVNLSVSEQKYSKWNYSNSWGTWSRKKLFLSIKLPIILLYRTAAKWLVNKSRWQQLLDSFLQNKWGKRSQYHNSKIMLLHLFNLIFDWCWKDRSSPFLNNYKKKEFNSVT